MPNMDLLWVVLFVLTSAVPDIYMGDVKHPCLRPCQDGATPLVCRYRFQVENYYTLSRACYGCPAIQNQTDCWRQDCVSADGVQRGVRTINRRIPGTPVQVCEGDTVEVEVVNTMVSAEGVTIHWHGLQQRGSPFMDGVAMVTQCPIPAGASFTYRFVASDPGTHFYHAHAGLLRSDGIFGGLVVRQPPSRDPQRLLYDLDLPEHEIVLTDWSHQPIEELYSAFYHARGPQTPDSILINGRGLYPTTRLSVLNGNHTPVAEFQVEVGLRYRFRLISAGSLRCPLEFSIDGQQLQLIASDGGPFHPLIVDSLLIYSGERYDLVLDTRNEKVGVRWIRVKGHDQCELNGVQQFAILSYRDHLTPPVTQLPEESMDYYAVEAVRKLRFSSWFTKNGTDDTSNDDDNRQPGDYESGLPTVPDEHALITNMTSLEPDDVRLRSKPDRQIFLEFAYRLRPNYRFHDPVLYPLLGPGYKSVTSTQVNNISNVLPPSPFLTQLDDLDSELLCNSSTVADKDCGKDFCECYHRQVLEYGEVVEIVIISNNNLQGFTHPLHLHGHTFRVVAAEKLEQQMTVELFKDLDAKGLIARRLHAAPVKDTFPIPNGGYMILRILADNPGAWFMHCHVAFHAEIGMSLTLQVNDRQGRLPLPPPAFPRCGSWKPSSADAPRPAGNDATGSKVTASGSELDRAGSWSSSSWAAPLLASALVANIVAVVALALYVKKRKGVQGSGPWQRPWQKPIRANVDRLTVRECVGGSDCETSALL